MNAFLIRARHLALLTGRGLLGLYFILPGVMKITGYAGTAAYMAAHEVPAIALLLPLTIVLQIGGGLCLLLGYRPAPVAFLLAGLTLVISLYMHDFWSLPEGLERAHEMQNFIKNLAIMAGLLCISGSARPGDRVTAQAGDDGEVPAI
ncbi:MAG: DoxX family protein [Pseudomonadales bacterium]|jgi:putative oxidoreductase|nr:DoxX family protein [Pseudomonadales bacterium]